LPSAPKIVQQKERVQDQNVSSTGTIADQVHDSEKSGINDNEKEEQKQIIQDLMMLVKNMESNQTNLINDVKTLCTHLEKRNREMEIVQNQHAKEIEAMKTKYETEIGNMQANHEEEINSMQHCLMNIKEENVKVIKDMEEHHAGQISAIKIEHSRQMDAIRIQVQKFQQLEDERNQIASIDQEPSHLLQQTPSYYEEVISAVERWSIEGDPDRLKNDKDQMQDKERHITHTSSDSFETESSRSSVIPPARKKKRKRKKIRRRFDASDGRELLDFRIGKSPTICKIGHGTSDKQPTDLPESRQMLSMHYIEHI